MDDSSSLNADPIVWEPSSATVRDSSVKRHCLIFPEGKGLALLTKKLRSLGVDYKKKVEVRKRSDK